MIDLILAHSEALFLDVQLIASVSMDADYQLVMTIVRPKRPNSTRRVGSKRNKLAKLNDPEQVGGLRGAVEKKFQEDSRREEKVEALRIKLMETTTKAADEILFEKKPYLGRKKMTPWWSEEVR